MLITFSCEATVQKLIENKKTERLLNNKFFYITLDDKKDLFIKKEYIALSYIGIYKEIDCFKLIWKTPV